MLCDLDTDCRKANLAKEFIARNLWLLAGDQGVGVRAQLTVLLGAGSPQLTVLLGG
jgi:hypothetical protein